MVSSMVFLALLVAAQDCRTFSDDIERLACFDAQSAPAEPVSVDEFELQKSAVDIALANSLRDPLSAIAYEVSDPLSCDVLSVLPGQGKRCICYSVNSKNAMGGYVGVTMQTALMHQIENARYVALPTGMPTTADGLRACHNANIRKRPASKIADQVSK